MNMLKSVNHCLLLIVVTAVAVLALTAYPLLAYSFSSAVADQSAPQLAGPLIGGGGGGGGNGGCC